MMALRLNGKREVPRRTAFIKVNHEDFVWLDAQEDDRVLPGLPTCVTGSQSIVRARAGKYVALLPVKLRRPLRPSCAYSLT